jgi:hypothetical protein
VVERVVQCIWVVIVAALVWVLVVLSIGGGLGPAAMIIGVIAAFVCLLLLLGAVSFEGWEAFWAVVAEMLSWMWWW